MASNQPTHLTRLQYVCREQIIVFIVGKNDDRYMVYVRTSVRFQPSLFDKLHKYVDDSKTKSAQGQSSRYDY